MIKSTLMAVALALSALLGTPAFAQECGTCTACCPETKKVAIKKVQKKGKAAKTFTIQVPRTVRKRQAIKVVEPQAMTGGIILSAPEKVIEEDLEEIIEDLEAEVEIEVVEEDPVAVGGIVDDFTVAAPRVQYWRYVSTGGGSCCCCCCCCKAHGRGHGKGHGQAHGKGHGQARGHGDTIILRRLGEKGPHGIHVIDGQDVMIFKADGKEGVRWSTPKKAKPKQKKQMKSKKKPARPKKPRRVRSFSLGSPPGPVGPTKGKDAFTFLAPAGPSGAPKALKAPKAPRPPRAHKRSDDLRKQLRDLQKQIRALKKQIERIKNRRGEAQ